MEKIKCPHCDKEFAEIIEFAKHLFDDHKDKNTVVGKDENIEGGK